MPGHHIRSRRCYGMLPALAADLVQRQVAVIVGGSGSRQPP
jgi:hypothetical protein